METTDSAGTSAAAAPPGVAPNMDPDTGSSDDEEIALPVGFPYHDYGDMANRFYHSEIEEIPSFRYMSASQRIFDLSFDRAEEQPSVAASAMKGGIPTSGSESGHTSASQLMPDQSLGRKEVGLPISQRKGKEADLTVVDVDSIIQRLLQGRGCKAVQLFEWEIRGLCLTARDIFLQQPMLLKLNVPIKIVGDIHGHYSDLLRIFQLGGFPPAANYLFLGNYVDIGKQSVETMCLLLAFKIKYPENFFLLRGNHESATQNRIYGFYDECKRRYNIRLWRCFTDCFNCLPAAAIVEDRVLCVHGGLSPDLANLDQINCIRRPTDVPDCQGRSQGGAGRGSRPPSLQQYPTTATPCNPLLSLGTPPPLSRPPPHGQEPGSVTADCGLLCDLLWSDPSPDIRGWGMNDRGVSYTFGVDTVTEFLQKHDLDLICRGNQVVEGGYDFFADKQLVTIFSAPAFSGQFENAGAMLIVDETLICYFQVLPPPPRISYPLPSGEARNIYQGGYNIWKCAGAPP